MWYVLIPWFILDTMLMNRRQLEHPDTSKACKCLHSDLHQIDHEMGADQKLLDPWILMTCELWLCYK